MPNATRGRKDNTMKHSIKRFLTIAAVFAMLLTLLAGCAAGGQGGQNIAGTGENPTGDSRYGGTLRLTYGTVDSVLDVHAAGVTAGTFFWAKYVYEGALTIGTDGKVYPLVCDYEYAEDGSYLKLWVREGVTFHDGTPVTVEDVLASHLRKDAPNMWENIESYEIEGDVLTYHLGENGLSVLYWTATYHPSFGIMPARICEQFAAGEINDAKYVIGTGAYKIVPEECTVQQQIVVERYDGYVTYEGGGEDNGLASPRRAYLDKIYCIYNPDASSRLMHLLAGDYDSIGVTVDVYEQTLKGMGYTMYSDETGRTTSDNMTLLFNLHENSPSIVRDVNLRKAILAALDYKTIAQAEYSSWWLDEHSPVLIDGYDTSALNNADYVGDANIELAKKYLEMSDYNGETIIFRRPSSAFYAAMVEMVTELKAAGINVEMEPMETAAYSSDYRDGTSGWDMYLVAGQATHYWPGLMNSATYNAWYNEEAEAQRSRMNLYFTGTEESIAEWNTYAEMLAEEVPFAIICKSKGDRFVQPGALYPNYTGYTNYWNAYWDDPSAHNN